MKEKGAAVTQKAWLNLYQGDSCRIKKRERSGKKHDHTYETYPGVGDADKIWHMLCYYINICGVDM